MRIYLTTMIALLLSLLALAPALASPPPRTAQALPAKIAHAQARARYLAHACEPLDFWHVICPMPFRP